MIHHCYKAASSTLKYAFRMELKLEDYTGAINAYLVEEDAVSCLLS